MQKIGYLLLVTGCLLFDVAGCAKPTAGGGCATQPETKKAAFPQTMVGVWEVQVGPLSAQKWELTFKEDGSVPEMFHYVAGRMIVKEGGVYEEGIDPNVYFMFVLGPVETNYDPNSDIIKVRIVIDSYEMKLPQGTLNGRLDDRLVGKASKDGQAWEVEWRSYGWLEGASDPDIDFIDKNPEIIVFKKKNIGDTNHPKGQ